MGWDYEINIIVLWICLSGRLEAESILILVFAIGFQETLEEKDDQLFHFADIDDLSQTIEIQASAVIAECLCTENSENCNISQTQTPPTTFQVEKGMVRKI